MAFSTITDLDVDAARQHSREPALPVARRPVPDLRDRPGR